MPEDFPKNQNYHSHLMSYDHLLSSSLCVLYATVPVPIQLGRPLGCVSVSCCYQPWGQHIKYTRTDIYLSVYLSACLPGWLSVTLSVCLCVRACFVKHASTKVSRASPGLRAFDSTRFNSIQLIEYHYLPLHDCILDAFQYIGSPMCPSHA